MTVHKKMHTIELSEKEIAAILFLLTKFNGVSTLRFWEFCKDALVEPADFDAYMRKHKSLSNVCGYNDPIRYHLISKDWEAFLGIGDGVNYKAVLDKVISLEKELAELKKIL